VAEALLTPGHSCVRCFGNHLLAVHPQLHPALALVGAPADPHDEIVPLARRKCHRTDVLVWTIPPCAQLECSAIRHVEAYGLLPDVERLPVGQLIGRVSTDWLLRIVGHGPTIVTDCSIHFLWHLLCGVEANLHSVVVVCCILPIQLHVQEVFATTRLDSTCRLRYGCSAWRRAANDLVVLLSHTAFLKATGPQDAFKASALENRIYPEEQPKNE